MYTFLFFLILCFSNLVPSRSHDFLVCLSFELPDRRGIERAISAEGLPYSGIEEESDAHSKDIRKVTIFRSENIIHYCKTEFWKLWCNIVSQILLCNTNSVCMNASKSLNIKENTKTFASLPNTTYLIKENCIHLSPFQAINQYF